MVTNIKTVNQAILDTLVAMLGRNPQGLTLEEIRRYCGPRTEEEWQQILGVLSSNANSSQGNLPGKHFRVVDNRWIYERT